jgi:hypothetical protein
MPSANTTPMPIAFDCEPSTSQGSSPMNPLSASEYKNSLQDLLAYALKDSAAAAMIMASLPLSMLPGEGARPRGVYRRMLTDVTQGHLTAWYQIATGVGRALTQPSVITTVMGPCAADPDPTHDAACLRDFVADFGAQAFRRPLTDSELTAHVAYDSGGTGVDPAGVADVIAGILLAPRFLYHVENGLGAVPDKDSIFTLDPYEVAARLSYHFWETMPDAQLWADAQSGALLEPAVFAQEVNRLLDDPRTKAVVDQFYLEWLNLDRIPAFESDLLFSAFVGPDDSALITPALEPNMVKETLELIDYDVATGGGLSDLLTTDVALPRTADLATIYGLPQWDGTSAPPRFAQGTRPGILTRAALLVSGGAFDRPIMRGVLVRRNLLCDALPDPPANAAAKGAMQEQMLEGTASTRQITEAITEQPGSACAGCHAALINPIGFAMENFDGLGRMRTKEALFRSTGQQDPMTGELIYAEVGQVPVDTTSVPAIVASDQRESMGAADLAKYIIDSTKLPACFARNYFRFTFRRAEDTAADACALEPVRKALSNNGSLKDGLRAIAMTTDFQQRAFQ